MAEEDKALGWCHENKVLELDPNLSDSLLCEIALHEFSHAFFPDMSEETITLFASQAADFLSAMSLIPYEDEEDDLR